MNFTRKMIVIFCSIVILLLLSISLLFYYNINYYIRKEFLQRLEDEAFTTAKLVESFQEKSYDILKQIDANTVDKSMEEHEIVLNEAGNILYESHENEEEGQNEEIDEENEIIYTAELLTEIKQKGKYQQQFGDFQMLGYYFTGKEFPKPLYVFISAKDVIGVDQRSNLKMTMLWSVLVTIIVIALTIALIIRWLSAPYTQFAEIIARTNENNLHVQIPENYSIDHLQTVAHSYNRVLRRLSKAFEQQHYFIQQASHELRTPVSLILSEIEAAQKKEPNAENYQLVLNSLQHDTERLTQLINSLLMLYKTNDLNMEAQFPETRIDEILYRATDEFAILQPECKIKIDFDSFPEDESSFFVKGHTLLLKSVFLNLLENGCKYSDNNKVSAWFDFGKEKNTITFYNNGKTLSEAEASHIFEPFYRAQNTNKRKGFGLGLSVTKRILDAHKMEIRYFVTKRGGNAFEISWKV